MWNKIKNVCYDTLSATLIVALLALGMGGAKVVVDLSLLALGKTAPQTLAHASGEYGKTTRTAEFLLGGGTDTTVRATGVLTYATGNSWSTSKPAVAAMTQVKLQGSNIRVLGAELDVAYELQNGAAVHYLQQHDVVMDVQGSQTAGSDMPASDAINRDTTTTYPLVGNGTGVTAFSAAHDVRGFFTTQTDSEFNTGIAVSVGVKHTSSTASRENTNVKLLITYEADIPTVAGQFLTKTVRLPLDSTAGTDSGTRNAQCAVNTSCAFTFDLADVPDMSANNIVSAFVETNLTRTPGTAVSITNTLNAAGSVAYTLTTTSLATVRSTQTIYYPIATSTLNIGASNTYSIANAAAGSQALNAVGGEVVLTYKYDTSAASQAETIRYMLAQGTGSAAANTNVSLGSVSPSVANSAAVPKSAWMRMRVPVSTNATFTSTSTVGANNRANTINLTTTGTIRSGDTPTIVHDFSSDYSSWGPISAAYRYSTANPQISAEVLVTFTWDGTMSSARTNTISFPASQERTTPGVASVSLSKNISFAFGESGNKTIRSAFVQTMQERGDTAPVTSGVFSISVDASASTVSEPAVTTAKEYVGTFYTPIPVSVWNGSANTSQTYMMQITESNSATDVVYFNNQIVITYDALTNQDSRVERSLHTVEFLMGGGTDATARATAVQTYVGTSWNTVKATAGQAPITIFGSNARVVSAYADVSFAMSGGSTIYGVILTGDATDGTRTLANMRFSDAPPSGITTDPYSYDSGTTASDGSAGYHRQFDVTALLSGYSDASLESGISVDFGLLASQSAGNRTLTAVKLVVTYAADEDLNRVGAQVITKTVRFPLATSASSCTTCNFSYTASINDLDGGTGSPILSAHYEVTATDYGTGANSATISVDGNATSSAFVHSEVSNDIATVKMYYAPPINTSTGFKPNVAQTARLINTVAEYGAGGEVVVTYRAYTGSSRNTETVVLPLGQVLASATSGGIGTSTMTLPGTGITIANIWLRVQHPTNNNGNLTIGGKVGSAANRQVVYAYGAATDLVRSQGVPTVFHDLTADKASFTGATTLTSNYAFSNATGVATYMNAEAVVTYTNDGGVGGNAMHTIEFIATPQAYTSIASRARARTVDFMMPKNMLSLTHVGAEMKLYHTHTATAAATNISVANNFVANIGAASSTVTESGDVEAYTPTQQLPITEAQLYRSTILPGSRAAEFTLYQSGTNMIQTSGVLVLTYTEQHDIARPGYTQALHRFYVDNDALTPTSAWHPSLSSGLGEGAGISSSTRPVRNGESVRIRMDIGISTTTMQAGSQQFRLEYAVKLGACSAAVGWTAIDGPAGSSVWMGKSGAPSAGATLATTTLSLAAPAGAGVLGTYEEGGTSAINPSSANPGQYVEYDWNIKRNGAPGDTEYCFRMAKNDGTPLDAYSSYPTIWTAPYTPETLYWNFYDDTTNETPLSLSSGLNIANGTKLKLRIGLGDVANTAGVNERYQLQWSPNADFAHYASVHAASSCTPQYVFCYADGGGSDGAQISTSVLGQGYAKGYHIEASSTQFSAGAGSQLEMEYNLVPMRQVTGQQYYFRLYDASRDRVINASSTLGPSAGVNYGAPTITSQGAQTSITIAGVGAGFSVAGLTTTATSTATSTPLGTVGGTGDTIIAQRIDATTTAQQGYRLDLKFLSNLESASGAIFATSTGSNGSPLPWSCSMSAAGCFGYHTTAASLSGGSTRFSGANTWAGPVAGVQEEIGYSDYPTSTTQYIVYRASSTPVLPAGKYGTELTYIVTPVY